MSWRSWGLRSALVSVWPLTTTSGTGVAGRAAGLVLDVVVVPVAALGPVAVGRAGVADAGGWAVDFGVAVDDLRLVGRRLVCAIDVDEVIRNSIAVTMIARVSVVEEFIRELIVCLGLIALMNVRRLRY